MSEAGLKLGYKLNRDDYWSAQVRILRQGPWRAVTIALGLWMISILVGSFYVMQTGPKWTLVGSVYAALYGALGLTLLAAGVMRFVGRFKLNRALRHSDAGPLAPTTLDVGAEGISWADGTTQTRYAWSAIERVEVTGRLVLLYSSPVQAIMIPRRVFGGDEAMLAFVASARENISAAHTRRQRR